MVLGVDLLAIAEYLMLELSTFDIAVWVRVSPVNHFTSNCQAFKNRDIQDTGRTQPEFKK